MDTFKEFKEDYRVRIKGLEAQLSDRMVELEKQAKTENQLREVIAELKLRESQGRKHLEKYPTIEESLKFTSDSMIHSKESLPMLPRSEQKIENERFLGVIKTLSGRNAEEGRYNKTP